MVLSVLALLVYKIIKDFMFSFRKKWNRNFVINLCLALNDMKFLKYVYSYLNSSVLKDITGISSNNNKFK